MNVSDLNDLQINSVFFFGVDIEIHSRNLSSAENLKFCVGEIACILVELC